MNRLRSALESRALAILLALFAVLYGVARIRYAPPAVVVASASAERFSGARARELQTRFVGDGATRYVGTPGNARGREVIAAELAKLGWTVETQNTRACGHHGTCAPVANVIGRLPGREPTLPGVLVTTHHDSVPAGPGASDDGFGVAALLECARALASGPRPPRRNVVVVFTDGEEAGLLGVNAFVREHPLASTVRTTVNIDSRGSRGPSQMFETSAGNAWIVASMAEHLERPVTTSLFYEVYRRMPNDTDFSITKTIASGVNFANTAGVEHYHTPYDALDVSDPGTLQQHGDNVLAMTRAFAELGTTNVAAPEDAVWFDVLAFGIVRWPARWSPLFAIVAVALVLGRAIRARAFDRGLVVFVPALLAGVVATLLVGQVLALTSATPAPWVAYPLPALVALHAAAGSAVLAVGLFFARKASPRALWAGTWIGWGALGIVTAVVAPGMSYLFIVPTVVAAIGASLSRPIAAIAPAAAAATLVLALATGLYETLGLKVAPLTALPTLLLATTVAPLLGSQDLAPKAGKRLGLGLLVLALGGVAVAMIVPKFAASNRQRVNVVFRQDDTAARVFVDTSWGATSWGQAPPSMLAAIGSPSIHEPALPWELPSLGAEVPRLDARAPIAEVLSVEDDASHHRVRLRLRSSRGAPMLGLFLPAGRRVEVKVEGRFASPRPFATGSLVGLLAVPEEGGVVDLDSRTPGPISFTFFDRTFGTVPGTKAEAAARARPLEATPSQDGDLTVLSTSLAL
jgi:hypothetical protein